MITWTWLGFDLSISLLVNIVLTSALWLDLQSILVLEIYSFINEVSGILKSIARILHCWKKKFFLDINISMHGMNYEKYSVLLFFRAIEIRRTRIFSKTTLKQMIKKQAFLFLLFSVKFEYSSRYTYLLLKKIHWYIWN